MAKVKRSHGIGDTIAKFTEAIGIEPCAGCNGRKAVLNDWFPYKNVIELTAQEKELIANIKDLEDEEVLVIYNFTFNTDLVIEQYQGGVKDAVINSLIKLSTY
jgi:hypothetical protein